MAYVSQERKAKLAPAIKAVCTKYGMKASLAVRNHSTLVINLTKGKLDLFGNSNRVCAAKYRERFTPDRNYMDVNPYWFHEHFDGEALAFITELFAAAKGTEWYDNSDAMTDYFDTAYYIDVNVGKWNKAYEIIN